MRSRPPAPLRSIAGGKRGRTSDPVAAAPPHLSPVARAIFHELAPGVFRTSTPDAVGRSVLGKFCEVMAADWATARRAPELAQVLGEDLGLEPAARRRLKRLAMSKLERMGQTKNEKTNDNVVAMGAEE